MEAPVGIPAPDEATTGPVTVTPENEKDLGFDYSLSFPAILRDLGISLAVTTYQAGGMCIITSDGEDAKIASRNYRKAMGCYVHPKGMLLAIQHQVLAFARAPHLIQRYYPKANYDDLYIPQLAYFTGDMSAHDVALMDGNIIAVATGFNCLVSMSPDHSFVPIWKPYFISSLSAEDRCHLNGMALVNGRPRYVTALAKTDSKGAWREQRRDGGIVIDVNTNQIIHKGLSMPHSPRVYQGDLWVLNSGTGEVGIVNSLGFQSMIYLPGFLRGLAFYGPYAFVGLSKIREKKTFGGLPIEEKVHELRCSVEIVNLQTGLWEGNLVFRKQIEELYDVQIIPNARQPIVTGYDQKDDLQLLFDLPAPARR
ncbi:TIGR03032 family protein [Anthocerotibacter panamensis]|uniref:TIGR03032 family protein n=1 Tax=Anthocerotibacter panamensis TaxID=2857077 RepID=UPI001C402428|nr:TIGR03032 family protein [Anthocerotibacter panamensis]